MKKKVLGKKLTELMAENTVDIKWISKSNHGTNLARKK